MLMQLNNRLHSWLDDREDFRFFSALAISLLFSTGISQTRHPFIFLPSLTLVLVIMASRIIYLKRGKRT